MWLVFRIFFFVRKTNIFDNVMYMMEKYADNLEDLVKERSAKLVDEQKKTETLLHQILPRWEVNSYYKAYVTRWNFFCRDTSFT